MSLQTVPNAPCGVESGPYQNPAGFHQFPFLMHRVELKALPCPYAAGCLSVVPNAPCGVERGFAPISSTEATPLLGRFLMHRVELKEQKRTVYKSFLQEFLMHRVELKG